MKVMCVLTTTIWRKHFSVHATIVARAGCCGSPAIYSGDPHPLSLRLSEKRQLMTIGIACHLGCAWVEWWPGDGQHFAISSFLTTLEDRLFAFPFSLLLLLLLCGLVSAHAAYMAAAVRVCAHALHLTGAHWSLPSSLRLLQNAFLALPVVPPFAKAAHFTARKSIITLLSSFKRFLPSFYSQRAFPPHPPAGARRDGSGDGTERAAKLLRKKKHLLRTCCLLKTKTRKRRRAAARLRAWQ